MMTTTTLREKFEAAFLEGKSRENILVSSQLQLGADGEYFNPNTKALFAYFCKGAASVVVELPEVDTWSHSSEGLTAYRRECQEHIEAAGGTVKQ
jgi:hypothetical protein